MQNQEQFSILLVDDDPLVIRILSRMLTEFTPVRFATSGRVALKLAQESVPDLVLLDVDMPDFGGFDVCKAFKSSPQLAGVPIIFITSHESPQLESKGMQLGAADFIAKPPHSALVLARVRTFQRMKMLSDTLRGAAKMDFVTGAATRRQLEKTLTQEWLRAQRTSASLSLLLVDIDGFTAYNAAFGEARGDACLRAIADAMRSVMLRATDLVSRYSGGKFALLLPETDYRGATTVARRVIDSVDALQLPHAASAQRDNVTISVGAGCRDSSRSSATSAGAAKALHSPLSAAVPDDLIAAAERALKGAAMAGGHQVRCIDIASLDKAQTA
jgi:diguanylate cyclase (GGDEF)-like protein